MPTYKGEEINTKPTDGMVEEAQRGLEWREEYGRGGTEVGVARARDITNRRSLSIDTVKRMASYFARHEVDKQGEGFSQGEDGYPSAGRIAWALWGGDAGQSWANRITDRLDSLDERSFDARPYPNEHAARVRDPANYDDFRRINNELGDGIHIIVGYNEEGSEIQSIRFDKTMWSEDEARQWLSDNDWEVLEFEPAIEEKAMTDEIEVTQEEMPEDRKADLEVTHRAMQLEASPINEDERRVRIAVSSEEPVMRSFGMEVLEHSEEAIDLSFLNSGRAPLLLDHDPEKQIGVVESVELDGSARRLRATVRFGKGALAREAFDDVVDGIRTNISVGYAVNKMERKDKDTFVVKSWRPLEASLVAIPADTQVGVGRSAETPEPVIKTSIKEDVMSEVDIAAVEAEARKAAQKNAAQIVELGARHSRSDLAQKAIQEGKSVEEFRGELLDVIGSQRALENTDLGLSPAEKKRFSIFNVVNALANPTDRRAQEAAAFEFEVSRAAAEKYGRDPQGIMVPFEVLGKRDLNSADDAALFSDDFRAGEFIDVLRNASSVMQAGARMLNGLSGDVKIPKKATAASAAWIDTEGGAATESEMTAGTVSMVPRQLAAYTDITRQLRQQSSLDVEALVRDDLAQALALAIDLAALSGSGSSGQPTGIKNTSGINTVDFGTAPDLVPTFAQVVAMETAVAEDNALLGNLAYIMPAAMYGALKTVEKATNTAQFVVEPGGTVNGYRTIVSNQCASGDAYFGNFNDLLVGLWSGVDLTVDPFSLSTTGTVRIVAFQTVDVAVRHAVSFCLGNDGGS